MAVKYKKIVFSFADEGGFKGVKSLKEKYLNKGGKEVDFYHVVLTAESDSEKLRELEEKYPFLANERVDIEKIKEACTDTPPLLKHLIDEKTKVIIIGHGGSNLNYIASKYSEQVTMRELAKLLKRNSAGGEMHISFCVCGSGTGHAVNKVEGSTAKALYDSLRVQDDNLCKEEIKPIISAPTFRVLVEKNGRKRVSFIIDDDSIIILNNQGRVIEEQIASLSVADRKDLEALYNIDKRLLDRDFHKGLNSKVVLSNGTVSFPYSEPEFITIAEKRLYDYYSARKRYRERARDICLQYLQDSIAAIAVNNPEIRNCKELEELEAIIRIHPYPYPELLSHIADKKLDPQNERQALLAAALDEFKDNIKKDKDLKNIQRQHMALARKTEHKLGDKRKALVGIGFAAAIIIIAALTMPFLPLIVLAIPLVVIGVAAFALGAGLAYGGRYLQGKQRIKRDDVSSENPKQREMKREGVVASASQEVSSESQNLQEKKEQKEEEKRLLPRASKHKRDPVKPLITAGFYSGSGLPKKKLRKSSTSPDSNLGMRPCGSQA